MPGLGGSKAGRLSSGGSLGGVGRACESVEGFLLAAPRSRAGAGLSGGQRA